MSAGQLSPDGYERNDVGWKKNDGKNEKHRRGTDLRTVG